MKKTQFLDACRNIRKELVAWLSIVIIGLLATVSYLGITYSAATLKKDALNFFNLYGLWDIEVTSTVLLDGEDLEAVRALPGVKKAEAIWTVDGKLLFEGGDQSVTVINPPETISQPTNMKGRYPRKTNECAVEKELADRCGLAIGDQITLDVKPISGVEPLVEKSFVITGIFQTPDHITYMIQTTPYIIVQEDCFNQEGLGGAFMKLRIRVKDAPADRYSKAYWAALRPVEDALGAMAGERTARRVEKIRSAYEEQLADGQRQLDAAEEQLRAAREQLDEGWKELSEGEKLLTAGRQQLDVGLEELKEEEKELRQAWDLLREAELEGPGGVAKEDWPSNIGISYDDIISQSGEDWEWRLALARRKLDYANAVLNYAWMSWYYMGEEYLDGVTRYERAKKQLEEGERAYADGLAQWEEGRRTLQDAQNGLAGIGEGRWVVLNNRGNAGFMYAEENFEKLSSLSMSFSTIFLIVGALVIYATIGRMVEQQRCLVGTVKAMGLYNREIFAKYLFFACSAVLLGVGLGILIAYFSLQRLILESYEKLLSYGIGTRSFLPLETGLVVAGALAISVAAVYLGCAQLLRLPAIRLMQGETSGGRQKKARKSAQSSLFFHLVFRNMRTDMSRVLVTIVSIAGGCALMVIGFTLRYGISGVPDRQFGGIQTYEAEIFYDLGVAPNAADRIEEALDQNGLPWVKVSKTDSVFMTDNELNAVTLIAAEKGTLEGYFTLRSVDGGAALELPDSGALVPRRFWEYYGVGVGESVPVYNTDSELEPLGVAGVFENYYGQLFFLTPQSYEKAFGSAPAQNCFFVKTNGMPLDTLRQKLADVQGVVKVNDAAADRNVIEQFTASLNLVVWLMLFIAGMMACFIVANFTLTYIQRKTRELTIMRINGFTVRECILYSALDLIVTTILGTLFGLLVGSILGRAILGTTETPYIQMLREPVMQTYLYSVLITFGFSLLTNSFALRRIKKLKLSDLD